MNRYQLLQTQPRAFLTGSIEYINNEWVFFDDEDDSAYLLTDVMGDNFEILLHDTWVKAYVFSEQLIKVENKNFELQTGQCIRVHKELQPSYTEFLHELTDEAFIQLTNTLEEMDYSLYDCIFCHNFLSFQPKEYSRQGTNFFIFDNDDLVCSLHHYFIRDENFTKDRFHFVRADGLVIEMK